MFVLLITAAWAFGASAILSLMDEFDDVSQVGFVYEMAAVKPFHTQLQKFQKTLMDRKQGEIESLFGKPVKMPLKTYALPVAQPRTVAISGVASTPSKQHVEFHPVKDVGALQVWYGNDGQSPILVAVYLKVDKRFPKLTAKNIAERLKWDQERFDKLVNFVDERSKQLSKEGQKKAD